MKRSESLDPYNYQPRIVENETAAQVAARREQCARALGITIPPSDYELALREREAGRRAS